MSKLFGNYGKRIDLNFVRGEGEFLIDDKGDRYLDFSSGISTMNLGHSHPEIIKALSEQLHRVIHYSNLYRNDLQEEVASLISDALGGSYVGFFCNSGAEANEAAFKLANKYTGRSNILSFEFSFHGRTLATLSATGQDKVKQGFFPLSDRMLHAPFNVLENLESYFDDNLSAVILEIVQCEGGINAIKQEFLSKVEELCVENGSLLIIDEVQTGFGRLANKFGFQNYEVSPDIVTMAKAIGNGYPIGAMFAKDKYFDTFDAGSHGTTFGGTPLAMAVAKAVCRIIFDRHFLLQVEAKSNVFKEYLYNRLQSKEKVLGIRVEGLAIGISLSDDLLVTDIVDRLRREYKFLCLSAGGNTLRLLPPLTVQDEYLLKATGYLAEVLL